MKKLHVFDPKHIAVLESKDRKTWQNPEEIMKMLELKPSYVVADLGCGSGYFTVPISRKVKKVYAIDVQKEMLDFLEQKIQTQKIENIEPLLSGKYKIPLENESVDNLITINTLHEFPDKNKTINEIRRILKPEGHAVIIDFKKEDTAIGPPVSIRVSQKEAKQLFEERGFTFVKSYELRYTYLMIFQRS